MFFVSSKVTKYLPGFNRNAVTSYSPGLPLRLPWERAGRFPTTKWLRFFWPGGKPAVPRQLPLINKGATALRLEWMNSLNPG